MKIRTFELKLAVVAVLFLLAAARAADSAASANQPVDRDTAHEDLKEVCADEKGPPLPLISIEGAGGLFATSTAYLVNPAPKGHIMGTPSMEETYVNVGWGRYLTSTAVTENLAGRVELGFAWERWDLGDLQKQVKTATGLGLSSSAVNMQNLNVRGNVVKEGDFCQDWLPALTVGVDFKYNEDYSSVNRDLKGTLKALGIKSSSGEDVTFYATKMIKCLPRPFLVSAGVRGSEAAETGFLGFTNKYKATAEANFAVFATDKLIIAGEYRQKLNGYKALPGLINREHDWFTFDAAYIITKRLTAAAGYGYYGEVLNHNAPGVWGIKVKYEF